MAMRLQEVHPALVHFPIALLPTTLVVDALGRATGNGTLLAAGRAGIAVAAGSALAAGLAGLVAQESSRFDPHTRDVLVTHRNLNLAVIALTAWMAARRAGRDRPGTGYLLAGLAGIGVTSYSAYLGGHMVYEHGVGVAEAGGVREEEAPHLVPERAGDVLRTAARHVVSGASHAIADLARGEVLPWLTRGVEPHGVSSGTSTAAGPPPDPAPSTRTGLAAERTPAP
jgi:uncharacterized membrane protein